MLLPRRRYDDVVRKLGGGTEAARSMGGLLFGVGSLLASESAIAEVQHAPWDWVLPVAGICHNNGSSKRSQALIKLSCMLVTTNAVGRICWQA